MSQEHRRALAARASVAVLAAALSGCVTVATAPTAATLKEGGSVVVVSITGNTARVGQFDTLTLGWVPPPGQAGGPDHRVVLHHVSRGLSRDTALFLAAVPPGEYELRSLESGQNVMQFTPGMRKLMGNVVVKPGKVHDLGRLVLTAVNTSVIVGRSGLVTSNGELVRRFAPDQAAYLAGEQDPGWAQARHADDRVEEYAQATPVGADGVIELADGTVAAGSRLGSILFRSPKGRWASARTGGLESILDLAPAPPELGRVVAVGELGTLAVVEEDGKVRRLGTGNLPAGNLFFVNGDAASGWVIGVQYGNTLQLVRSAKLEDGDWQVLRTFQLGASIWTGSADRLWAWPTPKGFAYALSAGDLAFYDRAAGTFTDRKGPNGAGLKAAGLAGPGVLAVVTKGVTAAVHVSRDDGVTWKEVVVPSGGKTHVPHLLPDGQYLVQGGTALKGKLHASKDGHVWEERSDKIGLDEALYVLPTAGLLAVQDGGQGFGFAYLRVSTDGGKSWEVEYSNFNREAYDAKKK